MGRVWPTSAADGAADGAAASNVAPAARSGRRCLSVLREAASLLGEHFIVTYGDILRRFHYDLFAENAENRLAVYPYQTGSTSIGSGNTEVNEDGRVTSFVKDGGLRYVDAGFASVTAAALRLLPREGPCSFESTVYPQLAATGQLSAEIVDFDFFDIGNPADLARTRAALEEH